MKANATAAQLLPPPLHTPSCEKGLQTTMLLSLLGTSSTSWVRALFMFCLASLFLVYVIVTQRSTMHTVEAGVILKTISEDLQVLEACNQKLQQRIDSLLNCSRRVDKQPAQKLIQPLEYNTQQPVDAESQMEAPIKTHGNAIHEPSLEYELMRRRVQHNIAEMWNFFSTELGKIRKQVTHEPAKNISDSINQVLIMGAEHKRSLLSDMERLRQLDGYEAWRHKEAKDLSALVQRRIHYLQNPSDCAKARKLVTDLGSFCGYGCQLHHAVYYLIMAYATERTLILESHIWSYNKHSWNKIFQPVSDTCVSLNGATIYDWPSKPEAQIIRLPTTGFLSPQPYFAPPAIPEDLAPRLKRLHGNPSAWWVGQFLKYLLRPQQDTKEFLESSISELGFKRPIVGVHVRRTDKVGTEAAFHGIEEYMTHVEDYFLTLEINGTSVARRVYLASDDASVIEEARKKYPQYEIIGDTEVARLAAVSTRYTDTALNGIILDIHLLSLADHLVCTFSSNVCRVAYEIMQTLYPDAAHRFKSLDDIYCYVGQSPLNRLVVIPHEARNHNEIHMQPGDVIDVAGNQWDGFSHGKNKRTNQSGIFPTFKVVDKVETSKMPTYTNV